LFIFIRQMAKLVIADSQ